MFTLYQRSVFKLVRTIKILLLLVLILPTALVSAQTSAQESVPFAKPLLTLDAKSQKTPVLANTVPLAGPNVLQDPSFEASFLNTTYWGQYSTNATPVWSSTNGSSSTATPRSGTNWVWFGGIDFSYPGTISPEIGYVYQNVTFPAGCSATLQFYLWIGYAQSGSDVNDYFVAVVDGTPIFSANATQIGSYPTYTLVSLDVSAWANGAVHQVEFYSNVSNQYVTFNLDDVSLTLGDQNCTISGNAGTAGVTLSYTDGIAKTATSLADGSYSFAVSPNWTGTVTPSHTCFTFNPVNRPYSNVVANQTGQNYTAAFNAASSCANINVDIGGVNRGTYGLLPQGSQRVTYALDAGPVKVISTNAAPTIPIIAALRDAYSVNGQIESFAQLMGLPQEQLSDTYYFPAYNNMTLDGQLRFGNVDSIATAVTVTIGGIDRGTYTLQPNESKRVSFTLDTGPVIIKSSNGAKIIAALRDAYSVNGHIESFVQLMGLPQEQLSDTYYFPAYNNVTLDGQLRFGNVDTVATDVTVTIGGIDRGTYTLQPNESKRVSFALDTGPVIIKSSGGAKIIAALRDAYSVNGQLESFAQLMGLPAGALSDTYHFPAYNNVTLDGQLRFGNVDTVATDVTVTIGGINRGTYTLQPNESKRVSFALDTGPVVIKSSGGAKIIAALRDAYKVNGLIVSFVQLMGLPKEVLSTTFWFPAYNNLTLSGQLSFAVP